MPKAHQRSPARAILASKRDSIRCLVDSPSWRRTGVLAPGQFAFSSLTVEVRRADHMGVSGL